MIQKFMQYNDDSQIHAAAEARFWGSAHTFPPYDDNKL
jgi:hypothetical protein